ncbi:uncharacterized protein LOC143036891 isoform X3 [Oratosquilla oratoria]|uniref:uncharacterized protein LOC143036891 isoform X3 n=1 Tax=Oratosquilla oratoria TaxID=337810 RepID=UPI003F75C994
MSLFVNGNGNPSNTQQPPKQRKKYETRYNPKYEIEYCWVGRSQKGEFYALCKWCNVDICIKSVGSKGLRNHEITGRHQQRTREQSVNNYVHELYPVLEVIGTNDSSTVTTYPHPPVSPQTPNTPCSPTYPQEEQVCPTTTSSIDTQMHPHHPQPPPQPPPPQPPPALVPVTPALPPQSAAAPPPSSQSYINLDNSSLQSSDLPQNTRRSQPELVTHPSTSATQTSYPLTSDSFTTPFASASVISSSQSAEETKTSQAGATDTKVCHTLQSTTRTPDNIVIEYDDPSSSTSQALNTDTTIDDLTCNVCGEVYKKWTQLKKHLLDHILMAQNKAQSNLEKKTKKGLEPLNTSPGSNRRRGRPPGSKNKVRTNEMQENSPTVIAKKRGRPPKRQADVNESRTDVVGEFVDMNTIDENAELVDDVEENDDQDSERKDNERSGNGNKSSKKSVKKKTGPLQCRVCRILFFNRDDLREHKNQEHNNGRPYQCDQCEKFFTTRNHLEVHVKHKHAEGPNPCQCNVCFKVLSSRTNLRIHLRIHQGERPFECPMCHKTFSRKANMEMHMVYHTGERKFTCEICRQSFFAINALKRHTKLHTGERDYVCTVCNATYVTGTDLRRHMLKHEEVKPYPCHLCEKQFTRSHDLKVHLRYHNKELRYSCDVCNKQFVESGNYKRHMRRHTGERPYSCHICFLTFSQVHHMKTHMKTSHNEEMVEAQTGQGSKLRTALTRNVRIPVKKTSSKGVATLQPHPSQPSEPPPPPPPLPPPMPPPGTHPPTHQPHHPQGTLQSPSVSPPTGVVGGSAAACHATPTPAHHHHTASAPAATAGMNHPAMTGFLQYNSHLYNHTVMPHYPTLFEMCPQQNSTTNFELVCQVSEI